MTPRDSNISSNGLETLAIDVWSDVVCPWCYIGKRRLEAALERFPRRDLVTVTWRSYQLDPSAPRIPVETTRAMLARKYGVPLEQADAMQVRVTGVAAQEGLRYKLEATRHESSFDAHRLLHLAKQHGVQDELKERLFSAHFCEGLSISDHAELVRLATSIGLAAPDINRVLGGTEFADEVRADIEQARALGIQGVPFFVIAGRYGVSGAQSAEVLLQAMEEAGKEALG